jgi:TonB family protein
MIAATVLLLAAWAVVPRLRGLSAAERHVLWAATLAVAAALPAAAGFLPAYGPSWAPRLADAWAPAAAVFESGTAPRVVVRAVGIEGGTSVPVLWLAAIWAAGAALALLRWLVSLERLRRLTAAAQLVRHRRIQRIASETARAVGLAGVPQLAIVNRALTPMTWGVRRATVLLPADAADWPDDRLRVALAHEFSHVRRGDWGIAAVAYLVCAAYWFHPLFWIAERRRHRDAECATDDRALASGVTPERYAEELLAVVRSTRAPREWTASTAMARPGAQLERRVRALLAFGANRRRASYRLTAAAVAGTLTLGISAAAFSTRRPVDVLVNATQLEGLASPGPVGAAPTAVRGLRVRAVASGTGAVNPPRVEEFTTPPLYSERARARRIEGVVTIGVHIDAGGQPSRARVLRGLGFGLDENALVALRQWHFAPGTRSGRPAAMDVDIDVEFSLASEAVNELIANDMATLVGPGITPPRVVSTGAWDAANPKPRGTVLLDVVLLEDGSPRIVRVLQGLDPGANELAVRHFEQWRFSPALRAGVPVKVRMSAEVRFNG